MEAFNTISLAFQLVNIIVYMALIIFPSVGVLLILRKLRSWESQKASTMRIDQLEENDSLIVEDVNTALSNVVERLTSLEEKLEKEERTVKGFRQ